MDSHGKSNDANNHLARWKNECTVNAIIFPEYGYYITRVSVFFISIYTLNVIGLIIEPWTLNHRYTNGPVYL